MPKYRFLVLSLLKSKANIFLRNSFCFYYLPKIQNHFVYIPIKTLNSVFIPTSKTWIPPPPTSPLYLPNLHHKQSIKPNQTRSIDKPRLSRKNNLLGRPKLPPQLTAASFDACQISLDAHYRFFFLLSSAIAIGFDVRSCNARALFRGSCF